jgi:hypothetical protein
MKRLEQPTSPKRTLINKGNNKMNYPPERPAQQWPLPTKGKEKPNNE